MITTREPVLRDRPTDSCRGGAGTGQGASILLLMPDPYCGAGGIARYGRDLIDAVSSTPRAGQIASVARGSPKISSLGPSRALPTNVVERRAGGRASFALHALRLARATRPALIVCGHVHYLRLATALKNHCGSKVVALAYGIDVFTPRTRSTGHLLHQVDVTVAVSRHTRRLLMDWSGLAGERVRVIGGAVRDDRTDRTAPGAPVAREAPVLDAAARARIRRRIGFDDRAEVLLTVGRMDARERYKGHDALIDALPAVLRERPDSRLLFVGGGSDGPRLRARAVRAGVEGAVRILDAVSDEDLVLLYAAADGFAMPSSREGFGYVFLEALEAGLPVLAGDADGARDPLGDGVRGVLVDPRSPEQVKDGALAVLECGRARAHGHDAGWTPPAIPEAFRFVAFRRRWNALIDALLEQG